MEFINRDLFLSQGLHDKTHPLSKVLAFSSPFAVPASVWILLSFRWPSSSSSSGDGFCHRAACVCTSAPHCECGVRVCLCKCGKPSALCLSCSPLHDHNPHHEEGRASASILPVWCKPRSNHHGSSCHPVMFTPVLKCSAKVNYQEHKHAVRYSSAKCDLMPVSLCNKRVPSPGMILNEWQ